jgi:hypothetical protein
VADEERWCDRFAAEALAPREQVRQVVHRSDSVVENTERVSECFGVSFSTSLKRINETTGSSWRVIMYWRRQGRWIIHSTVDIPKGTASTFRTVAATRDTLEHLPSYRTLQIFLPIGAFGRDIQLPATAVRHDDYCQLIINWLDLARAVRATLEPPWGHTTRTSLPM